MIEDLLIEITRCPVILQCLNGDPGHPCSTIVDLQRSTSIVTHQLPEPWSGQINQSPILFISSNPSISNDEIFPTSDWNDEKITDYFQHRFGEGQQEWVINGTKSLQRDGSYGRATMFWAGV